MKRLLCLLFLTSFVFGGCSVIQKNSYWKTEKQIKGWSFVNGKMWSPYYTSVRDTTFPSIPYYVYCNNFGVLSLSFMPTDKCIWSGPPLLPFIPGGNVVFPNDQKLFSFEVSLKTVDTIDTSNVLNAIHFFVNGNQKELIPKIDSNLVGWKSEIWSKKPHKGSCDNNSPMTYQVRFAGTLDVKAANVETVRVQLGDELKNLLSNDARSLYLRRKSRPHYFAFQFPSH